MTNRNDDDLPDFAYILEAMNRDERGLLYNIALALLQIVAGAAGMYLAYVAALWVAM